MHLNFRRFVIAGCALLLFCFLLGSATTASRPNMFVDVPEQHFNPIKVYATPTPEGLGYMKLGEMMPTEEQQKHVKNSYTVMFIIAGLVGLLLLYALLKDSAKWIFASRKKYGRAGDVEVEDIPDELDGSEIALKLRNVLNDLGGSDGDLVIKAWRQLEVSCASLGVTRQTHETSSEYTLRILSKTNADSAAVDTLSKLYQEVYYSTHERHEQQNSVAKDAIDTIIATLEQSAR